MITRVRDGVEEILWVYYYTTSSSVLAYGYFTVIEAIS